MGEGKEWVLESSEQSHPCGAREDHPDGAAWNWDCVGFGLGKRVGRSGPPGLPLRCALRGHYLMHPSTLLHSFQLGQLSLQQALTWSPSYPPATQRGPGVT